MATHITDLPVDVVSDIISAVAKAPDGARDVARSMLTCQLFLAASKSIVVQRAVCFDHAPILCRTPMFLNTEGLLYKCASARNPSAEFQLAQIILIGSTQLMEHGIDREKLFRVRDYHCGTAGDDAFMASFITRFTPAPGTDPTPLQESDIRPLLYHWEFVKVFILKSTSTDILVMSKHVCNYIAVFVVGNSYFEDVTMFKRLIFWLWNFCNIDSDDDLFRSRRKARDMIDDIRVKALHAFEVIIPRLS